MHADWYHARRAAVNAFGQKMAGGAPYPKGNAAGGWNARGYRLVALQVPVWLVP